MAKNYCLDCGSKVPATKYFMVTNDLWDKYGVGNNHLCMGCFEKRLGRLLNKSDLLKCFVNEKVNPNTIKIWDLNLVGYKVI
jgi:hypothetical protein